MILVCKIQVYKKLQKVQHIFSETSEISLNFDISQKLPLRLDYTSNPFKKKHFQPSPSFNTKNEWQSNVSQKGFYNQSARCYKSGMGFNFYKKRTQPQQFRKSPTSKKSRKQVHKKYNTCSSSSKGIVHQASGGYVSSWRHFFAQLGKSDKQQKHFELGQGIRTKIFIGTISKQGSEKHAYVKRGKMLVEQEIQKLLRKGAITRTNNCKNELSTTFF